MPDNINKSITPITLYTDTEAGNSPVYVLAKQYDSGTRVLKITLKSKSGTVKFNGDCSAQLNAVLPSGETKVVTGVINEDNTISVTLSSAVLSEVGKVRADITVLYSRTSNTEGVQENDTVLTSATFYLVVSESGFDSTAVEDNAGYGVLQGLIGQVSDLITQIGELPETLTPEEIQELLNSSRLKVTIDWFEETDPDAETKRASNITELTKILQWSIGGYAVYLRFGGSTSENSGHLLPFASIQKSGSSYVIGFLDHNVADDLLTFYTVEFRPNATTNKYSSSKSIIYSPYVEFNPESTIAASMAQIYDYFNPIIEGKLDAIPNGTNPLINNSGHITETYVSNKQNARPNGTDDLIVNGVVNETYISGKLDTSPDGENALIEDGKINESYMRDYVISWDAETEAVKPVVYQVISDFVNKKSFRAILTNETENGVVSTPLSRIVYQDGYRLYFNDYESNTAYTITAVTDDEVGEISLFNKSTSSISQRLYYNAVATDTDRYATNIETILSVYRATKNESEFDVIAGGYGIDNLTLIVDDAKSISGGSVEIESNNKMTVSFFDPDAQVIYTVGVQTTVTTLDSPSSQTQYAFTYNQRGTSSSIQRYSLTWDDTEPSYVVDANLEVLQAIRNLPFGSYLLTLEKGGRQLSCVKKLGTSTRKYIFFDGFNPDTSDGIEGVAYKISESNSEYSQSKIMIYDFAAEWDEESDMIPSMWQVSSYVEDKMGDLGILPPVTSLDDGDSLEVIDGSWAKGTKKQDKLIAGRNISIEGNVISSTGGGSGGGIMTPLDLSESVDVSTLPNNVYQTLNGGNLDIAGERQSVSKGTIIYKNTNSLLTMSDTEITKYKSLEEGSTPVSRLATASDFVNIYNTDIVDAVNTIIKGNVISTTGNWGCWGLKNSSCSYTFKLVTGQRGYIVIGSYGSSDRYITPSVMVNLGGDSGSNRARPYALNAYNAGSLIAGYNSSLTANPTVDNFPIEIVYDNITLTPTSTIRGTLNFPGTTLENGAERRVAVTPEHWRSNSGGDVPVYKVTKAGKSLTVSINKSSNPEEFVEIFNYNECDYVGFLIGSSNDFSNIFDCHIYSSQILNNSIRVFDEIDSLIKSKNRFESSQILCIGDSITEANWRAKTGWVEQIRKVLNPLSMYNDGKSGTGIIRGNSDDPTAPDYVPGYLARLSDYPTDYDDVDIVLIMGNMNDYSGGVLDASKLGEFGDSYPTDTTQYGVLKTYIEALISKYPTAKFGWIISTPRQYQSITLWGKSSVYDAASDAIKEMCANYSIPVLDLYRESNLMPWVPANQEKYFVPDGDNIPSGLEAGDGVHPNTAGHTIMANKIYDFIIRNF